MLCGVRVLAFARHCFCSGSLVDNITFLVGVEHLSFCVSSRNRQCFCSVCFVFVGSSRYVSTIFSVFIITRASVPLHGWMARSFSLAGIGVFISDFCVFVIFLFLCWLFAVRRTVRPVRSFFVFDSPCSSCFLATAFRQQPFLRQSSGTDVSLLCIFVLFWCWLGSVRVPIWFSF